MIKRLLLSLGVIAVVGGLAVFGTQALLSDEVTLTTNAYTTGTADLEIANTSGIFNTTSVVGFTDTLNPGENVSNFFFLRNVSDEVDLAITAQAVNLSGAISTDDVTVTIQEVDIITNAPIGSPVIGTLTQWIIPTGLGITIDEAVNNTRKFSMNVAFSAAIDQGGAQSMFDFLFTGEQVL